MKKIFLLLMLILVTTTGCSMKDINDINSLSNKTIINKILKLKIKTNTALKGYKIYLPTNMTLIEDSNNNDVLFSDREKYYLYVDLISYYNKKPNSYKVNSETKAVYSKTFTYNKKTGYVLVTKYNEDYFLETMYNYSKIEIITKDYKKALVNSLIVLNSVDYNDKIIETLIGNNTIDYDEETYTLIGPSDNTTDFLKYEEEYGTYDDTNNELPDEDTIQTDITE